MDDHFLMGFQKTRKIIENELIRISISGYEILQCILNILCLFIFDLIETNVFFFQIPQLTLDRALDEIAAMLPHFVNVKNGLEPAKFCGRCDYCKSMKKAGIRDYNELVEQWEKRGREPAA